MDYRRRVQIVYHRRKKRIFIMKYKTGMESLIYDHLSTMPFIVEHFVEDDRLFLHFTERSYTLDSWISMGQSEEDRMSVLTQILYAYQCMHRHGVYHIDIKPQNVLVFPDKVVKIIDFDHSLCMAADRRTFDPAWTLPYIDPSVDIGSKGFKDTTDWEKWDLYVIGLLIIFVVLERDFDLGDPEYISRCPVYDRHTELLNDVQYIQNVLKKYDIRISLLNLLHGNPHRRLSLTYP